MKILNSIRWAALLPLLLVSLLADSTGAGTGALQVTPGHEPVSNTVPLDKRIQGLANQFYGAADFGKQLVLVDPYVIDASKFKIVMPDYVDISIGKWFDLVRIDKPPGQSISISDIFPPEKCALTVHFRPHVRLTGMDTWEITFGPELSGWDSEPIYFADMHVTQTVTRKEMTVYEVADLVDRLPNVKTVEIHAPQRRMTLGNLLYPQYAAQYELTPIEWSALQANAARLLRESPGAEEHVIAHWKSIVAGKTPFGLRVYSGDAK